MTNSNDAPSPRDRSPAFPVIPLEAALGKLAEFEGHFKRTPARAEKVGEAWGIKTKAYADRIAAALRYFGLLEYQGAGKGRSIVVSDDGRKYLRAQQEELKREIVKAAALRPKQIAKYWNDWGTDRPADPACLDLLMERGFGEGGARDFLKVYVATITFAKLSDSDKPLPNDDAPEDNDNNDLEDVDEDELDDVPNPRKGKAKLKVMEGERELTTGLLAKDANFRLLVSGHVGVTEIDRLIRKLELDKEILADPDDLVIVHSFSVWDAGAGDYVVQPLKSPADRIARIGGEIVPDTAEVVKRTALDAHGRYKPAE